MNLFIFGDSIAYGAWDKEGGWAGRLRRFLDEKTFSDIEFKCLFYNLSISGDTTEELLERFDFEIEQRYDEGEKTAVIFAVGINDSCWLNKEKRLAVAPEKFKSNLQKLVEKAKKFSVKVIFLGLTPVDEAKVNPIPWDPARSYKQKNAEEFDAIIKSVAEKNKLSYIHLMDKLDKTSLADGVHPDSQGHQKIFEAVKEYLVENRII